MLNQEKINFISSMLDKFNLADEPGSVFYSGNETLVKGDYYFLGLNPGGNTNLSVTTDTIKNQLHRKEIHFNEYLNGVWKQRNKRASSAGMATLQLRIKMLFNYLGINLKNTCCSNLVFVRSPVKDEFKLDWNDTAEKCWEIHRFILSVIKPKFLIVFGDDAKNFVHSKMKISSSESFELKSHNKDYRFGCDIGIIKDSNTEKKICLLSTPHLSRFKINAKGDEAGDAYDARFAINWMNEKIEQYHPQIPIFNRI